MSFDAVIRIPEFFAEAAVVCSLLLVSFSVRERFGYARLYVREIYSVCLSILLLSGCAKISSGDRAEYWVTGRVVDSGGMSVGGAEIAGDAESIKAVSDRQGLFSYFAAPGHHQIRVSYMGKLVALREFTIRGAGTDLGNLTPETAFYVRGHDWFKDGDRDLYSDGTTENSVFANVDFFAAEDLISLRDDCNDFNPYVYLGADELIGFFDNSCDSFANVKALVDAINLTFHEDGSFGDAELFQDIRFQETVSFLALANIYYGDLTPVDRIRKSIRWSFENLRDVDGGFFQRGVPQGVRTSLFLLHVASACLLDSRLADTCSSLADEIYGSASWVASIERPWYGNHDIAALLAFQRLFQLTGDSRYKTFAETKRRQLLGAFIHVDSTRGYWPEGPADWSNRLLTEYLQIQIMFGGYYLLLNPADLEFKNLFHKEIVLFAGYADMDTLSLDVTDSYAYPDYYSDWGDFLPLSVPSVPWLACVHSAHYCDKLNDSLFQARYFDNLLANFERDDFITLYTDAFLRYSLIEEISDELKMQGILQ